MLAVLAHVALETTGAMRESVDSSDAPEEVQPLRVREVGMRPLRRRIPWDNTPQRLVELGEGDDPIGAATSIASKATADLKGITNKAMSSMQRVATEAKNLANVAAVDKIKADGMLKPKDKSLDMYPLGQLTKAQGNGSVKGGNTTNSTAFRDWWNAKMPEGESAARKEAQTRLQAAMKEIASSRKREKEADSAEKNRLLAILADEKKRQTELLKETMMNTSDNGWWDLPKWQPANKSDYDVTKGYPPPVMPKEWMDIYGPNAKSYMNGTSLHIAYDKEGYPKPWNNTNSTNSTNATTHLLGSPQQEDSNPVAAQDDKSIKIMQETFDKDLTSLSEPRASLREGIGDAQLTAAVPRGGSAKMFPTHGREHSAPGQAVTSTGQDVPDGEVHILDDLMGNPVIHLPVPMGDDDDAT